jgi:hypothetical protein
LLQGRYRYSSPQSPIIRAELRSPWRRGLEAALAAEPDNLVPYHLFRKADKAIQEVATNRLKLFNRL